MAVNVLEHWYGQHFRKETTDVMYFIQLAKEQ